MSSRLLAKSTVLSLVIPVYNEESTLPLLYGRIVEVAGAWPVTTEVVLVNDGSRDGSLRLMHEISEKDPRFVVVDLSRNFGHQLAVAAGLSVARGDVVAILDADLQDPPELIGDMLELWAQGYDVVYGKRRSREGEGVFKKISASLFYRVLTSLASVEIPRDTGDFRLVDRAVVDVINRMPEQQPFLRGLFAWLGFRQGELLYDRKPRAAGETKYPLRKMIALSADGVLSFSVAPLRWVTYAGIGTTALAFLSGAFLLVVRVTNPDAFSPGIAGMFVANLFMFGMNFVCLGMIGEYLGRAYLNTLRRPRFVIRSVFAGGAETTAPMRGVLEGDFLHPQAEVRAEARSQS